MSKAPTLRYFVSETYGKNTPDPTDAVVDADVHLETDLAVMEDAIENGDPEEIKLLGAGFPVKINSRGREISLPRHLAGIMESWHDSYRDILAKHDVFNGLFINYAPRDHRFRNGPSFYEVETDSGLRIVTTFPGDMLSGIRDRIKRIVEIPNENNPLFGDTAQFRSRDVHRYLRRDHSYPTTYLSDDQADTVLKSKYFGNGVEGIPIDFVDIYGNIVGEDDSEVRERLLEVAQSSSRNIRITINGIQKEGEASHSLTEGRDGCILAYPNGNHIDVVRKWKEGEDSTFTTENSAFVQFERPRETESGIHIDFMR